METSEMSENGEEKETSEIYEKAANLVDSWSGEEGIGEKEIMEAFEKLNDEERDIWLKICAQIITMPSRRAKILLLTLGFKYNVILPTELHDQEGSPCPEK